MPRYPIRARRRPGRVGLFRQVYVVGGAAVEPVAHAVPINDTLALTDAQVHARGKAVADALTLADARTHARGTLVADALTLADATSRAKTIPKSLADTVALTDSASPNLSVAGTDHTASPSDTLSLADAITIAWVQDRTGDTVTITDAVGKAVGKAVADSLTLADARTFARGKAFADGVILTDQTIDAQGVRLGDTVSLTDSLSRVAPAVRAVDDSVTLADARAHARGLDLGNRNVGKQTVGASAPGYAVVTTNYVRVSPHDNSAAMLATEFWFYFDYATTGQTQSMRGVVYADSSGEPGALLGVTEERTFSDSSAPGWYGFLFPNPVALPAGQIWIGFHGGGPHDSTIHFRFDSVTNSGRYNADTYSDGPSDPHGTPDGTDSLQVSMYVRGGDGAALADSASPVLSVGGTDHERDIDDDVVLADARAHARGLELGGTRYFGELTGVGTPTYAISRDYKQVSPYTLSTAMVATHFRFMLDYVTTGESQAIRGVIYADSSGSPGALLGVTEERVWDDGTDPGWNPLPFATPVALPAGTYWIGVHAGGPDATAIHGIVNFAVARKYNFDEYYNGASDPFGTPDATDSLQFSYHIAGVESGVFTTDSPARVKTIPKELADAILLADARALGRGKAVADSLALADSLSRIMAYGRTQADGLILVDSTKDAQGIRLGDVLVLADALARAVAAARTLTDSVTLADATSRVKTIPKSLTDSLVLTDARALARGKALADAITLADQLARVATYVRAVADSVSLADNASPIKTGAGQRQIDDAVTLADLLSRAATYARSVTDSLSLSDAQSSAKTIPKALADTLALTDALTRAVGKARTLTDSVVLADARAHAQGKAVADALILSDLLSRTVTSIRTIADTVAVTDAAQIGAAGQDTAQVNDLLALADALARAMVYQRSLADTVTLADARQIDKGQTAAIADIVLLSDALTRTLVVVRSIDDTLVLTDVFSKTIAGPFQRIYGRFRNRPQSRVTSIPYELALNGSPQADVESSPTEARFDKPTPELEVR